MSLNRHQYSNNDLNKPLYTFMELENEINEIGRNLCNVLDELEKITHKMQLWKPITPYISGKIAVLKEKSKNTDKAALAALCRVNIDKEWPTYYYLRSHEEEYIKNIFSRILRALELMYSSKPVVDSAASYQYQLNTMSKTKENWLVRIVDKHKLFTASLSKKVAEINTEEKLLDKDHIQHQVDIYLHDEMQAYIKHVNELIINESKAINQRINLFVFKVENDLLDSSQSVKTCKKPLTTDIQLQNIHNNIAEQRQAIESGQWIVSVKEDIARRNVTVRTTIDPSNIPAVKEKQKALRDKEEKIIADLERLLPKNVNDEIGNMFQFSKRREDKRQAEIEKMSYTISEKIAQKANLVLLEDKFKQCIVRIDKLDELFDSLVDAVNIEIVQCQREILEKNKQEVENEIERVHKIINNGMALFGVVTKEKMNGVLLLVSKVKKEAQVKLDQVKAKAILQCIDDNIERWNTQYGAMLAEINQVIEKRQDALVACKASSPVPVTIPEAPIKESDDLEGDTFSQEQKLRNKGFAALLHHSLWSETKLDHKWEMRAKPFLQEYMKKYDMSCEEQTHKIDELLDERIKKDSQRMS